MQRHPLTNTLKSDSDYHAETSTTLPPLLKLAFHFRAVKQTSHKVFASFHHPVHPGMLRLHRLTPAIPNREYEENERVGRRL